MTAPETRERIEAAAARLRRHLAQPGAFARLSPLGCGRIALYRSGGGATLGAGFVPKEAADALAAQGDALWSGQGEGRRLHAVQGAPDRPAIAPAVIERDGRSETVMLDTRESPLLWLHRRPGRDGKPQISDEEFAAGERFRADWTLARLMARTTMNWDASLAPDGRGAGSRGPAAASDSALAARQRVRQACDRLGPQLSGLVIDVCGFLKGLDAVERERGWPARSAKVVLRLALEALVAHYGLGETRRPARTRPSVWREEGARPAIMPRRTG
ncbi:MAG TPA: DUF6456 domain-containing protein [Bosea sp. (in: a-proteobacteria)]|uniref:DUF6456 domain-containing protein n=1 Tax=Bosea sp. (in: a-proteobacteria) TaxID=1871050 RepID=UPI002DDCA2B4|nr:DUF6456 domain-containing protein [Bosea sp. (in: a-proteobacteria)]HEV2553816.1 DUF6456 domain-containing protein [Bosea sp. (in: a-proteobacteria)]